MTTSLCFVDNYPEAVSTVNVTNNTITFDGADANFYEESFTTATMTADTTFTLAHYPVSAGSIALYLNSGAQIQGTDYTVSGNIITLTTAATASDTVLVRYFAYEADLTSQVVPVGSVMWQASNDAPAGYALADGTTGYAIADYTALYTYCTDNSLILSETATDFIVKDLGQTVGAVVLYAIIKT